jgi:teichoic acid transport system permease protein
MIAPIERRLGDHPALLAIMTFNPAFLYMDMARSAILDNELPPASQWLTITAWGVGMLVVGFLFFLQREQEYGRG